VPLPSTFQNKNQNKIRNSTNLCFFLSIAFALIPANFITIIIREREQNTKHLQIISGISLIAYWLSNFIFELVKYFVTGGICLSLMQIFGQCTNEMWLFYVIYGFSMVPFSYIFSFIFKKEASAQNLVILLNFLFGSLGGTIVFVLRTNSSTVNSAKFIANIMRIVPAFSLNYSYVTCLS
jgi:ATP-binding cassette subfamily A (ABC1) protein 3